MNKNKKFSIYFLINRFPVTERESKRNCLMILLKISKSTFQRLTYATVDSSQTMSAENLFILATYFKVKPADIFTEEYKKYLHSIKFPD